MVSSRPARYAEQTRSIKISTVGNRKCFTDESSVKVEVRFSLETEVVSEKESNEDAGNDDISQTEHCKVGGI